MIYQYKQFIPVIHESSFIHPQAAVTGNVIIGKDVYIGPGAAIRGDWGMILIGDGCNVQENCTLHMFPGKKVMLMDNTHIGHGAVIHGATIGRNSLIGMNSVIMDDVIIGDECIVGAMSFIKAGEIFEQKSLVAGNPAKFIKNVSAEMINWKSEGTALYQQLARELHSDLRPCEPLRELPADRPGIQEPGYKPWKS